MSSSQQPYSAIPQPTWDDHSRWIVSIALILGVSLRFGLLWLPHYAQVQYEEAEFGLIALNILKGHPAMFLWGSPYHGVLECYFIAVLYKLFGVSTFVLRLEPWLMSVIHMFVLTWVARRLWGPRVAAVTAVFLAIPPLNLTTYAALVYPSYLAVVILGTLCLYLLSTILLRNQTHPGRFFWLGGMLGLAFWEHAISIPLIAFTGLLLLLSITRWLRTDTVLALLCGVIIGGLPIWIWNFTHHFNTFRCLFGGYGAVKNHYSTIQLVGHTFYHVTTYLMGIMTYHWSSEKWLAGWQCWFWFWYSPVILCWLLLALRQTIFFVRLKFSQIDAAFLFLCYMIIILIIAIVSGRTTDRYSFAIYSSWPLLVAFCAVGFGKRRSWITWLIMVPILILHIHDNGQFLWKNIYEKSKNPRPVDAVINYLDQHDLKHFYAHYRVSREVTFETAERIIGADFYGFKMPMYENFEGDLSTPRSYLHQVDLAPRKAILTHKALGIPYPKEFDSYLAGIGGHWHRQDFPLHVLYDNFTPPYSSLTPIAPKLWQGSASQNNELTDRAFDRATPSAWHTPQSIGSSYQIDLGQTETVAKILLHAGVARPFDYPKRLQIEASQDGVHWQDIHPDGMKDYTLKPGLDWFNGTPRLTMAGGAAIYFPQPVTARHFRFTITVPESRWQWTIEELYIFRPDTGTDQSQFASGSTPRDSDRSAVAAWLNKIPRETIHMLYTEPEDAPSFKKTSGAILPLWDIYATENTLNFWRYISPEEKYLFVIGAPNRPAFEQVADKAKAPWNILFSSGSLAVYQLSPTNNSDKLFWSNEGLLIKKQ